jgi:SAM-dependent methyltransferase
MADIAYIHYGCGLCAPSAWRNFDNSPSLRLRRLPVVGRCFRKCTPAFPANVRYGDIVKGLPVAENSCAAVFCSHVLEHLALNDLDTALRHTFAYLKPGGTFRLVVPDLEQMARGYLSCLDKDAAIRFMESTCLGHKVRRRGFAGFARAWLGNSAHLWMWDERSLSEKLREHGFTSIRRASFGDAEDARFREVEDRGRFNEALAINCKK